MSQVDQSIEGARKELERREGALERARTERKKAGHAHNRFKRSSTAERLMAACRWLEIIEREVREQAERVAEIERAAAQHGTV